MRPNLLLPAVANTDYLIWKEDKDYEGHIKRLKNINDKQVNVVKKYQNLDRLIDYSHKKRELVKDFNNKEFVHNQGLENSRIKKKLVEIQQYQSKENKHLQDQNKYTEMLFNNNKIITQKYKNEVSKQLEQENLIIATRILKQRSQYEKEKQSSHFDHHLLFKRNIQRFKRRDRGLVLSINVNNLDEYSPNNSIFEVIRNTASNSSQILNNQSSSRTNSANNSFIAEQSQNYNNDKDDRFYHQHTKRSVSVNNTVPIKNGFDERYLIDQITEQSKDINSCEMSVDTLPQSTRNKKKLRNNISIQQSSIYKQKEIDEKTKKEIIGGRDIFLNLVMKSIKFKSFIPNETDDDLFYFVVSGGRNRASKTQLKSFKKIQCSNYHLAFTSNKFKDNIQKVTFSLWQNKNNNDIFQGEFSVDVSQEQQNLECRIEIIKKTTQRTFVSGQVHVFVTIQRLTKESHNSDDNNLSLNQDNINLSAQNDINQEDKNMLNNTNDNSYIKEQSQRRQQN